MARLGSSFTFLRRSFLSDTKGKALPASVRKIQTALSGEFSSSEGARKANTVKLKKIITSCLLRTSDLSTEAVSHSNTCTAAGADRFYLTDSHKTMPVGIRG
jgi:hypothetical protein